MTRKEILDVLRRCASVRINENGDAENIGSIARSWNPALHPGSTYPDHYYRCKAELESLPWHVVADPRNPKDCEYPSENGTYVTMLDCNEHEVLTNDFRDGFWTLYHKTHVKWWMRLPEDEGKEEKRLITKQFLEKHGFEYLERFGFWYRDVSFPYSYNVKNIRDGIAFRYRYDKKELETQRYYPVGADDTEYHSEEDGYRLIEEYAKEGLFS